MTQDNCKQTSTSGDSSIPAAPTPPRKQPMVPPRITQIGTLAEVTTQFIGEFSP